MSGPDQLDRRPIVCPHGNTTVVVTTTTDTQGRTWCYNQPESCALCLESGWRSVEYVQPPPVSASTSTAAVQDEKKPDEQPATPT